MPPDILQVQQHAVEAGRAKQRLEEALQAIDRASDLGSTDALLLNCKGNALGLLLRWEEARAAYTASTEVTSLGLAC